ncbi:unnamed protein product, partial [Amoebophrya sp. A120]|eukprot:GSA120T00003745001.1
MPLHMQEQGNRRSRSKLNMSARTKSVSSSGNGGGRIMVLVSQMVLRAVLLGNPDAHAFHFSCCSFGYRKSETSLASAGHNFCQRDWRKTVATRTNSNSNRLRACMTPALPIGIAAGALGRAAAFLQLAGRRRRLDAGLLEAHRERWLSGMRPLLAALLFVVPAVRRRRAEAGRAAPGAAVGCGAWTWKRRAIAYLSRCSSANFSAPEPERRQKAARVCLRQRRKSLAGARLRPEPRRPGRVGCWRFLPLVARRLWAETSPTACGDFSEILRQLLRKLAATSAAPCGSFPGNLQPAPRRVAARSPASLGDFSVPLAISPDLRQLLRPCGNSPGPPRASFPGRRRSLRSLAEVVPTACGSFFDSAR